MSWIRHALPFLTVAALVVPSPAQASSGLAGTWELDAAKSDNIEKAIDRAVEKVNFVIRGFAHGRLKSTNQPYKTVTIVVKGKETHLKTDDRAPIVCPTSGTPIKWTREDGQKYDVSMVWKGDTRLEETFANDEGKRVNVFTLGADGNSMVMEATVTSPKLPVPLEYKLAYKRAK